MPLGASALTASPPRLGDIYYVSLAGSFLGKPDMETGETTVIETEDEGCWYAARLVGFQRSPLVSERNTGDLGVYDPCVEDLDRAQASRR